MKCNRNRLHCQFNSNRRLRSQLNLDIFTLHHCALNRGCGGWVSSFIVVCYGYVLGKAMSPPCALNPEPSPESFQKGALQFCDGALRLFGGA